MKTKTASLILGIIFLLVGLLGFLPNPIIGMAEGALFHSDTVHNIIHVVSGLLFVFIAVVAPSSAPIVLKIFGAVYFLLGVLGMINMGPEGMTTLLGFLRVNEADNYFHIVMGLIVFLAGFLKSKTTVTT